MPRSVVLLSEDYRLSAHLKKKGITTETIRKVEHSHDYPVKILPAKHLVEIYKHLGTLATRAHSECTALSVAHTRAAWKTGHEAVIRIPVSIPLCHMHMHVYV